MRLVCLPGDAAGMMSLTSYACSACVGEDESFAAGSSSLGTGNSFASGIILRVCDTTINLCRAKENTSLLKVGEPLTWRLVTDFLIESCHRTVLFLLLLLIII